MYIKQMCDSTDVQVGYICRPPIIFAAPIRKCHDVMLDLSECFAHVCFGAATA